MLQLLLTLDNLYFQKYSVAAPLVNRIAVVSNLPFMYVHRVALNLLNVTQADSD